MTRSETVELVQNIVIIIWFLWPARYRMKNACVVRHSHGDWTIKSLIQYLLPRAECEDKGILHWSDAINAINAIATSHLFNVKLFRMSLHISMKSPLELLYKNRISLKSVRLLFCEAQTLAWKMLPSRRLLKAQERDYWEGQVWKNIWLSHFFHAH